MNGRFIRMPRLPVLLGVLLTAFVGSGLLAPPAQADSVRARQWYLDSWKIDEAWQTTRGSGITVAVVDTGVDATHPDLVGQVLPDLSASGDRNGHGTAMASLIAGQGRVDGGQGLYGVAPSAKILPFQARAGALGGDDPASLGEGVRLAADSSARIINLSVGGSFEFPALREAVAYALSKGKLVIAAGGNNPPDRNDVPVYPAAYPGVLAVSSVDRQGSPASNGVRGSWVSISSPGEDIPSACTSPTRYCVGVGSSAATALTSGVAALVWSVHPDWTANQVIRRLLDTANRPNEPVPSDTFGYGVVSPRKALAATDVPGPADVNPLVGVRGDKPSVVPTAPGAGVPSAAASVAAVPGGAAAGGKSGDGNGLLVASLVGSGVVVVLGVGGAAVAMRRRRRREAVAGPPSWPVQPPPYSPPYGGPYDRR
ncbi:S8 family serine peptidase [Embleya sp. AB8]|uniref:S8 family serine peptidase n=1 Tax=Embleya sp. AB8 TaxID=3156304 RepID=UPI003C76C059